jgi:hypothetical protein
MIIIMIVTITLAAVPRDTFKAVALNIEDTRVLFARMQSLEPHRQEPRLGPCASRKASRYWSDQYMSIMTGDGQNNIPPEVVGATMEEGRKLLGGLARHTKYSQQSSRGILWQPEKDAWHE